MQPLPMNELVKEQLEAVGFKVDLEPMDWNALIGVFGLPAAVIALLLFIALAVLIFRRPQTERARQ